MSNVLFLSPTVDTAGLGIGMKRAFDAHGGEWKARHVRTAGSWLGYDRDIQWQKGNAEDDQLVRDLWEQADVVQIHEMPFIADLFPKPARKVVVYHLGTYYRRQPAVVHAQCVKLGATECVDMHDLMRFGVTEWLPDVIDPAPLAALRASRYEPGERVRVMHAPTDRIIKSTAVIEEVMARLSLRKDIPAFDFEIIEKTPNAECLARKATADLFIDELTLGYGLNALECWSMGIPVVSGVADRGTEARMRADFGALPFVNANSDTLEEIVAEQLRDADLRRHWGLMGQSHIRRFHSPAAVVQKALEIYER